MLSSHRPGRVTFNLPNEYMIIYMFTNCAFVWSGMHVWLDSYELQFSFKEKMHPHGHYWGKKAVYFLERDCQIPTPSGPLLWDWLWILLQFYWSQVWEQRVKWETCIRGAKLRVSWKTFFFLLLCLKSSSLPPLVLLLWLISSFSSSLFWTRLSCLVNYVGRACAGMKMTSDASLLH